MLYPHLFTFNPQVTHIFYSAVGQNDMSIGFLKKVTKIYENFSKVCNLLYYNELGIVDKIYYIF